MNVRDIVDLFGGQSALAGLVGINQSAVAYWVKKGAIPTKWHSQLLSIAMDKRIALEASDLIARPAPQAEKAAGHVAQHRQQIAVDSQHEDLNNLSPGIANTAQPAPFMFYAASSGAVKVQVLIEQETVWASQKGMAEIFDVDVRTINEHLQNIFKSQELLESTVIRKFRITAVDNKNYDTGFYSLDAIISVGYRVNSYRATQFRVWATSVLKEYLIKGYSLDDERLKQGKALFGKDYFDDLLEKIREIRASERRFYQKITDIYAQCSIDYDPNSPISQQFYAHVQDKLHYAIHGHTSAELIDLRVDARKPNMGLTHWKNEGKGGKITKTDVTVGKNYLTIDEIKNLDRLVSMYLDWAENFARRQRPLTMAEWAQKLDGFLEFNAYDVLDNFGKVERDKAEKHAVREYEKYRIVQDQQYKSDFDRVVDEIKISKKLPNKS
jgi:hypothetical protein